MNIVDQAWDAFGKAYDAWRSKLTDANDAYYFDTYGTESLDAFFKAHPSGWPVSQPVKVPTLHP